MSHTPKDSPCPICGQSDWRPSNLSGCRCEPYTRLMAERDALRQALRHLMHGRNLAESHFLMVEARAALSSAPVATPTPELAQAHEAIRILMRSADSVARDEARRVMLADPDGETRALEVACVRWFDEENAIVAESDLYKFLRGYLGRVPAHGDPNKEGP